MGAWIEIPLNVNCAYLSQVAPLVGAWIEISSTTITTVLVLLSLLSWERGLKLLNLHILIMVHIVAPLVGAWIEILNSRRMYLQLSGSLLSWERGLKLFVNVHMPGCIGSLLSWERGLKFRWRLTLSLAVCCRSSRGSVD